MKLRTRFYYSMMFFLAIHVAWADDTVDLEGARIFGNRDLPNITYIIPWKEEALEVIDIQPITNLFDSALQPIDRELFLREIGHLQRLQKSHAQPPSQAK